MSIYHSYYGQKFFFILIISIFIGCSSQKSKTKKSDANNKNTSKTTATPSADNCQSQIMEGLEGVVIFKSGDFMPSPNARKGNGKKQGVERIIGIFELTSIKDVKIQNGAFYDGIQTKLVKKISSDKQGCFKAELPAGRYSIFVWEKEQWYANRYDDQNNIYPIEIKSGQVTNLKLEISYRATY